LPLPRHVDDDCRHPATSTMSSTTASPRRRRRLPLPRHVDDDDCRCLATATTTTAAASPRRRRRRPLPHHVDDIVDRCLGSFAVEYHDMYVLFTLLFYGLYSHEHFSDQTKIRRQQLVDLCARYKLTRSGNMNTLRASLRSFSSNQELWERCVSIPLTQSQTAQPVF
jgi:hypothetical protein